MSKKIKIISTEFTPWRPFKLSVTPQERNAIKETKQNELIFIYMRLDLKLLELFEQY